MSLERSLALIEAVTVDGTATRNGSAEWQRGYGQRQLKKKKKKKKKKTVLTRGDWPARVCSQAPNVSTAVRARMRQKRFEGEVAS